MKFSQYLIEKIGMVTPNSPRRTQTTNEIKSEWTTKMGNRVCVTFMKDNDEPPDYNVIFSVNGSTDETDRASDKEILQNVLYEISDIVKQYNIMRFSFDAHKSVDDNKKLSRQIKPFMKRLQVIRKQASGTPLYHVLVEIDYCIKKTDDYYYQKRTALLANEILAYPDLSPEAKSFATDLAKVMQNIMKDEEVPDTHNRRLHIYKKFLAQYLGAEWSIREYNDSIYCTKSEQS